MAYAVPEENDDDELRAEKAIIACLRLAVNDLMKLQLPRGQKDRKFIEAMDLRVCVLRQMPARDDIKRIKKLRWDHRRRLPAPGPKLNPCDPIVQEMEAQDARGATA